MYFRVVIILLLFLMRNCNLYSVARWTEECNDDTERIDNDIVMI